MGRFTLILILGFSVMVASSWLSLNRISGETSDEVNRRFSGMIAKAAANSATQRAIAQLDSSYHSWTAGYSAVNWAGATYWTTINNPTRGIYFTRPAVEGVRALDRLFTAAAPR